VAASVNRGDVVVRSEAAIDLSFHFPAAAQSSPRDPLVGGCDVCGLGGGATCGCDPGRGGAWGTEPRFAELERAARPTTRMSMLTSTSAHEPVAMRTRSRKAVTPQAKPPEDASKTVPITPPRAAKRSRTSSDDATEVIELEDVNSRPVLSLGSVASIRRREQSVQWIINTSKRLRFQKETLFLACNIFDRVLHSMQLAGSHGSISEAQHLLLAATALHVAAKYEELQMPRSLAVINELEQTSHHTFNSSMVIDMEASLLRTLGFRLHTTSPLAWLGLFLVRGGLDAESNAATSAPMMRSLKGWSVRFLELALGSAPMTRFSPSIQAAAALHLAHRLHALHWTPALTLRMRWSFSESELAACIGEFEHLRMQAATAKPKDPIEEASRHVTTSCSLMSPSTTTMPPKQRFKSCHASNHALGADVR
jgi:hypothetical protein